MPKGFASFHRHAGRPGEGVGPESLARPALSFALSGAEGAPAEFSNDESAARHYLNEILSQPGVIPSDVREAMSSLSAPERPENVPDLLLRSVQQQAQTGTRLVRFQQTQSSIEIFGSNVLVELDADRNFVGSSGDVANIKGVSPVARLSPIQALRRIAKFAGAKPGTVKGVAPPELTFFYQNETDTWHLAYFCQKVRVSPPGGPGEEGLREIARKGHGFGLSPRLTHPEFDYLVDAHDGSILYYYSANPLLDVPTQLHGQDENGADQPFWGLKAINAFTLDDPVRGVRTFDLRFGDLEQDVFPNTPVSNSSADFAGANTAAVSAHLNATRVLDFYKGELKRDSIDDKGMDLVSAVNVTSPAVQPPPEWFNACWWNGRMWYGQVRDSSGKLRSFSRFLDVIAHELTHGITERTANLVYRSQPGALNESFSDIFGVIIRNWYETGPNSNVSGWNWEIGSGLGENGLPLRDMKNPARCGYPDHMSQYRMLPETWQGDWGGVHTNSNIHNKAAYNVLTAGDDSGNRVFEPREVAILYYLTLTRLDKLADFAKTLQVLVDVASTFYAGNPALRDQKIAAIKAAYAAVGIN
ncbi:MAG: M4 family metallopeptidase [Verrucomicrobiia bacterium]